MLVNAPLVDQLADAMPGDPNDENARANCVPASLASGLMALVPGQTFYADALKDAVYGEGYTGGTDPAHFVAYLASAYHVTLSEQTGGGDQLVADVLAGVRRHVPVTGAIPSEWGITTAADVAAHGGPTHEILFCDASADGSTLTAMNPWPVDGAHAFYQTMPASWWASRLVYGRVFMMTREVVPVWVQGSDGFYHDSAGHVCGPTVGAYLAANGLIASNGLDSELYPPQAPTTAFLALDNGAAVISHHQADGSWMADENAAQVLLALFHAANTPPPPAPPTTAPNVASAQQALSIAAQAVAKAETLLGGQAA